MSRETYNIIVLFVWLGLGVMLAFVGVRNRVCSGEVLFAWGVSPFFWGYRKADQ